MLSRVLEPEAMDTPEEAREYDAMDHATVNARFVADFLAAHGPCRGGELLDVGTGTARIPIALCQTDPAARVLALDLADAMLALARENVEAAGFAGRIRCARADAKERIGDDAAAFEAVLSNSIVHHLGDPAPALAEMARRVAPGGTLFVRDLARPASEAELDHLLTTYAGKESPAARALFSASLRAALTVEEVQALIPLLGCPVEGVSLTSDRHWTWIWRRPR